MARSTLLLQQQSASIDKSKGQPLAPYSDPWQWWTPQVIANITQCPVLAVVTDWPIVYAALEAWGIADYDTCRAVLATIAIETAHTFAPVQEAFWLDDAWRYANLRYAPYWGRGYVQLTWEDNYRYYGWRIGHTELVTFPDKAMVPTIAAQLLAAYFVEKGVNLAAQRRDWRECRRLVQGAYAGIDEFVRIVDALGYTVPAIPLRLSTVLAKARTRYGDPYVWDGDSPGGFDCSGFVAWAYDFKVTSYTDAIYDETSESIHPASGDIVLYEYYDPTQPNTRFPHVGLYLDSTTTLDARGGVGVGVHPHVVGARLWLRRVSGVRVDTVVAS